LRSIKQERAARDALTASAAPPIDGFDGGCGGGDGQPLAVKREPDDGGNDSPDWHVAAEMDDARQVKAIKGEPGVSGRAMQADQGGAGGHEPQNEQRDHEQQLRSAGGVEHMGEEEGSGGGGSGEHGAANDEDTAHGEHDEHAVMDAGEHLEQEGHVEEGDDEEADEEEEEEEQDVGHMMTSDAAQQQEEEDEGGAHAVVGSMGRECGCRGFSCHCRPYMQRPASIHAHYHRRKYGSTLIVLRERPFVASAEHQQHTQRWQCLYCSVASQLLVVQHPYTHTVALNAHLPTCFATMYSSLPPTQDITQYARIAYSFQLGSAMS
jgi:hypothetical protein